MFRFTYNYCDHIEYLHLLATALQVPVNDHVLWLPKATGTGYIKVEALANGLQVLVNECTLHKEFYFKRNRAAGHHFTLRFDEVRNLETLSVKLGDTLLEDNTAIYSGAFLSNPYDSLEYVTNAETESRCVNIYFTKQWVQEHFGIGGNDEVWNSILPVDKPAAHFEVLTIEYRELMEDVFALRKDQPLYITALQNRVMLLLEKFLRNLYGKMTEVPQGPGIAEADLKRMIQVEALLVKNTGEAPPPVPELARMAMMSETKLKNLFKRIYDYSLYEYYQRNRMLKARQLIASRKYSVKEVGSQLGFRNLSNFTIAFKKQFNKLPSEL